MDNNLQEQLNKMQDKLVGDIENAYIKGCIRGQKELVKTLKQMYKEHIYTDIESLMNCLNHVESILNEKGEVNECRRTNKIS